MKAGLSRANMGVGVKMGATALAHKTSAGALEWQQTSSDCKFLSANQIGIFHLIPSFLHISVFGVGSF